MNFEENKYTDQQIAMIQSNKKKDSSNLEQAKPKAFKHEEQDIYNLDVCFMIDATGSMQPSIDMARDKIKEIISELKSQYNDSKVRIAIVAYRDQGDRDQYQVFKFSESVDEAHLFLGYLKAFGGKDAPEDVNGGFRNVLTLEWKTLTTKMLYHLADAPCHGRKFHNVLDNYPDGLKTDERWDIIFKKLAQKEINYLYYDIGGTTSKMFKEFKKLYDLFVTNKIILIFSYEVMQGPKKTIPKLTIGKDLVKSKDAIPYRNRAYLSTEKKSVKIASSLSTFESDAYIETPSSTNAKQFVMSTVCNAKAQQMRNISYQQAKLGGH
jgi:hypothetical protein